MKRRLRLWNQGAKNVEGPCSKKTQAWPDCCGPCDTYPAQPCPPFTGHWPADSSRRSLAATSWPRRCLISSRVTWVEGGSSGRKSDHSFFIHQRKSSLGCKHCNSGTGEIKNPHVSQPYFFILQYLVGDIDLLMYLFIPNTDTRPSIKRIQRSIVT